MRFSVSIFTCLGLASMAVAAGPPQMPALTGKYNVGTHSVKMTDNSRKDPFAPDDRKRSILVQLYYPTGGACSPKTGLKIAPWGPKVAIDYLANGFGFVGNPFEPIIANWETLLTRNLQDASIDTSKSYPVVLFSPAYAGSHLLYQAMISDLASHGFIVAAMSHTYESPITVFPDGEAIEHIAAFPLSAPTGQPYFTTLPAKVRLADSTFVLNELSSDRAKTYIPGLKAPLDVSKCGMFGHSLGGATTVLTMANDKRVITGMDLDGTMQVGTNYLTDLKRPIAFFFASNHNSSISDGLGDRLYMPFLELQSEPKLLNLTNAVHTTFTDAPAMYPLLGIDKVLPPAALAKFVGTIEMKRAAAIIPKYIADFFGNTLKGEGEGVMAGPSKDYPEVLFMDTN